MTAAGATGPLDYQKTLQRNQHGFLSDLEEFMHMNYQTTATDSKNLNIRNSSMSAQSFQTQKKLAIQKLKHLRK